MTDTEKSELAKIIKKAKGSRSSEEFARKIGITKYQLSRIINGKFKDMPRQSTLMAIRDNAESEESRLLLSLFLLPSTYENINGEFVEVPVEPENILAKYVEAEMQRPEIDIFNKNWNSLLGSFGRVFDEWTKKADKDPLGFDTSGRYLFIELNANTVIKKWYFYFLLDSELADENLFYSFIGKLSCRPSDTEEKFSLVVASDETYDKLCMKNTNTNSTLSIISFDLEHGFINEQHLETATGVSQRDLADIQLF